MGFSKMVVPNNHWFSYCKLSFWGVSGVPPFKETPTSSLNVLGASLVRPKIPEEIWPQPWQSGTWQHQEGEG